MEHAIRAGIEGAHAGNVDSPACSFTRPTGSTFPQPKPAALQKLRTTTSPTLPRPLTFELTLRPASTRSMRNRA